MQLSRPSPNLPSRVIILGSAGFIGRHLIRHLRELGVPILAPPRAEVDLESAQGLGPLRSLLRREDAIVVLAALTPDRGRDVRTFMANLRMGENLCSLFADFAPAHVVYVSSDAVYDDGANPVREDSSCNPSSLHGLMHLARERMLAHVFEKSPGSLALLRPTLIYGPGDTHNGYGPNRFLRAALKGERIALFGEGEELRDHIFVGDVCRLIALALRHRAAGTLNLATGHSHSFRDVAATAVRAAGRPVAIEGAPRRSPVTHRHFDVTQLIKSFPNFRFTTLDEGLAAKEDEFPK